MACHYPRTLYQDIIDSTGEFVSRYSGTLFYSLDASTFDKHYRVLPVPCGQCLGCQLDKAKRWADRMLLELDHSKVALFATLTYDDLHVPRVVVPLDTIDGKRFSYTLKKRDCQLFFKRLRKAFPDTHIRYYLAGEYGGDTFRPHYHAIIYGLQLSVFSDLVPVGTNDLGQDIFSSELFASIWENGFVSLAPATYETMAYTARYVTKKVFNPDLLSSSANPDLVFQSVQPEFALMSLKPGIAGFFFRDHPDFLPDCSFSAPNADGVVPMRTVTLPRYLLDRCGQDISDLLDQRRAFVNSSLDLQLQATDLDVGDYLAVQERILRKKNLALRRHMT